MTAIMYALNALRRVPRDVWFLVAGVALVSAGYFAVVRYGAEQYKAGKKAATEGVVFDSVTLARAAEVVAHRTAHTDTVTRTVLRTRYKVDTLIQALPDSAYQLPGVPELVATVNTLTVQVDSLIAAHAAERLAVAEQQKVNASAIYALRVIGTAQRDSIVQLSKRPTRLRAFGYAVAAGALGVVVGVVK